MIITISGLPGSGKSTVGRLIAERLGYKFYSMGDMRGKMATDRGLTIDELNELGKKEDWTDREIDEYQKKLGQTEDNFVVDGKLSFYFIPQSFKIFLDIDLLEATKRLQQTNRPDEPVSSTLEDRQRRILERIKSDDERYQKYYQVSSGDHSKYDIVVDTTNKTPEEITDFILTTLKKIKKD